MTDEKGMNPEDLMSKMFSNNANGDVDIFDAVNDIVNDDFALGLLSTKVNMDKDKLRQIIVPFLGILKTQGVQMFSAGDDARAAKIQYGVDTLNSYASIVRAFFPIFKTLYQEIKSNKAADANLGDDDWDSMMLETPQPPQSAQPQPQPQKVGPDFISRPASYSAPGTERVSVSGPVSEGLTMEVILRRHMKKYGKTGMQEVLSELKDEGMHIDIEIPTSPEDPSAPKKEVRSLKGLTLDKMIENHRAKFGDAVDDEKDRKGWDEVEKERASFKDSQSDDLAKVAGSDADSRDLDGSDIGERDIAPESRKRISLDDMPSMSPFDDD